MAPTDSAISVKQAAALLSVTPRTIRNLILSGSLAAFSVGQGQKNPVYRITEQALSDYIAAHAAQTKP